MLTMRRTRQRDYPIAVELAGAALIWWRELTRLMPLALPQKRPRGSRNRLIPLTYSLDRPHHPGWDAAAEHPQFWNELVTAAEASSGQRLADAKAVRRLVRFDAGEIIEMKLAHRSGKPVKDRLDDAVTAFFRFEDAAGPLGFAAVEQYGREGLLRSVLLLEHRRGSGVGSEMVSQVLEAAAALGVKRLWLLTETAAPFFAKQGFRPAERGAAPKEIAGSSEFRSTPASAICMAMNLAAR